MLCVQDTCNDLYTNRNLWNTAYNLDVTISDLFDILGGQPGCDRRGFGGVGRLGGKVTTVADRHWGSQGT